eukprot:5856651-Pyramimonas_sp.AAC.1
MNLVRVQPRQVAVPQEATEPHEHERQGQGRLAMLLLECPHPGSRPPDNLKVQRLLLVHQRDPPSDAGCSYAQAPPSDALSEPPPP